MKNKLFSILNIFGLAVGIATCLLLTQYIFFEYSYDRFHENAEYIYRIPISYSGKKEMTGSLATNHPTVGPTMKMDFPEVQDFCRLVHPSVFVGNVAIKYTNESGSIKSFREEKIYFADSSIFTMFSFPLISGDPSKALTTPNSVALSETAALKYFGKEDPVGKTLDFLGVIPLKVTAIFANIPDNSHIQFDILISYLTIWRSSAFNSWKYPQFYNYIQLKPDTDPAKFEAKFPSFVDKYLGAINKEFGFQNHFLLQPITDIHLKSVYANEPQLQGSEKKVRFLSLLAVIVLTIAWINYVNLTMAKSLTRAREVGLRKVIGAKRSNLITQFLADTLLVNVLATILSIIMVALVWPYFHKLAGNNISGNIFESGLFQNPYFWVIIIVMVIFGSLLSGLYPSLKLSSFQPAQVIKGNFFGSAMGIRLRKLLVLFQFTITIAVIAGTLLVRHQLRYMMNENLGFRKDHLIILKSPAIYDSTTWNRTNYFKSELERLPQIISITSSTEIPGHPFESGNTFRTSEQQVEDEQLTNLIAVDIDFFRTFNIPLISGRYFNLNDSTWIYNSENNRIILNRKATEILGFTKPEQAVGQLVYFRLGPASHKAEIIGVVENYHQRSLREAFDPILFYYPTGMNPKYFCIYVQSQKLTETVSTVRNLYKESLPANPFDYFFLDEYFDRQYRAENQFENMFSVFTLLAVIVACLGLYGLSSFMIHQRYKEIGIRKVLGSSVFQILILLYKDFSILIFSSLIIAGPFIYLFGQKWLNNFSFRIEISWSLFVVPVVILFFISIITSGVHTIKAALENPVNALRYE